MHLKELYKNHGTAARCAAVILTFLSGISLFSASIAKAEISDEIQTSPHIASHIIGIDPGHQGPNVDMSDLEPLGPGSTEMKAKASTGTQGTFSGLPEYQLNLDVSLKLQKLLEDRGYETVLTRTDNDTAISNKERAEYVADQGAEICVRIHANGAEASSAAGALTISPSSSNPYVPQLYEESSELSQHILDAYCAATGFDNRGITYADNMTGINWSTIPVTIVEMGFMTNESDDLKMSDPDFQDTMAAGIADGIDNYFAEKDSVH
nr:N-acetylmuramoyl-L-alanine amidase [uncultured Blautia sp.]